VFNAAVTLLVGLRDSGTGCQKERHRAKNPEEFRPMQSMH
jgi:hypothetical protein